MTFCPSLWLSLCPTFQHRYPFHGIDHCSGAAGVTSRVTSCDPGYALCRGHFDCHSCLLQCRTYRYCDCGSCSVPYYHWPRWQLHIGLVPVSVPEQLRSSSGAAPKAGSSSSKIQCACPHHFIRATILLLPAVKRNAKRAPGTKYVFATFTELYIFL